MARAQRRTSLKHTIRALRTKLRAQNQLIIQLEAKLLAEQIDKSVLLDTLATVKESISVGISSLLRGGSPYT